ncbi:TGL1 [Candida pseudojiufengensis]|uniref:TGL1 n=1 Tax=Candida pseudojiufengensis TaxID=497109 RepID=UPI002224D4A6|nr:TGL1 [Candida pseudojiufengensis]KAI5964702.1 TGL1 [Candida pseudojiufengensis]
MPIPFIGRLSLSDWPVIIVSFTLAWFEFIVSVITNLLPIPIIKLFTFITKQIFRFTPNPIDLIIGPQVKDESNVIEKENFKYQYLKAKDLSKGSISKKNYESMIEMLNADKIQDMVKLFGYDVESRIVTTKDDYLLTIHRIKSSNPSSSRVPNGKVIYLHHGLLMCSEIWVTMIEKYQNLPFILYDLGYDVWLGNNRGNKYSQKHLFYNLNSTKYWNFSLDEFAIFDIPNTIDYILNATNKEKLTYIGFSQGSAQAFASVSINTELNSKIDQLIAISPATTPHGLYSKFLDILLKSSPNIIYLLFSRKVLMPSCIFWQKIMYPPLFDKMIDISNYMLFNWKAYNISKLQKLGSYAHLYSTTSVKCVVHWFQVMRAKNFQMYHDVTSSGLNPISYPLKNIDIPIHLIYGTTDSLVDIDVMKNQLPSKTTTSFAVVDHEHLDNLWGFDVYEVVFKQVLKYLGEDLNEVNSKLFRQNADSKFIEDMIDNSIDIDNFREVGETSVVVDGKMIKPVSSESYLKQINNNSGIRKESLNGKNDDVLQTRSNSSTFVDGHQSFGGSSSVFTYDSNFESQERTVTEKDPDFFKFKFFTNRGLQHCEFGRKDTSKLIQNHDTFEVNEFHPSKLLSKVKSKIPRSINNEKPIGVSQTSTESDQRDPILNDLSRLQPHEAEFTIKETYDDDMVDYSASLQELLYLLVEEKQIDDHVRMNIEQSLVDIISYLPIVEDENFVPESLSKPKKDLSRKQKQNIPKPSQASLMNYPNSYLSRIVIDNFELIMKFSTTYFNLSLSSKVTKYLVELIYQLHYWEIVHLTHLKKDQFSNFLKLIGFDIIETLFGKIIKPPENYLNDDMLQGLQYPFPYPFYNYSYHSFNSRAEDNKWENVNIKPYIDLRLKKSPILNGKKRGRKLKKIYLDENNDDEPRVKRKRGRKRKASTTASSLEPENIDLRESNTPSILDFGEETDDNDLSGTMSNSESLDDEDVEDDSKVHGMVNSEIDQTEDEIFDAEDDEEFVKVNRPSRKTSTSTIETQSKNNLNANSKLISGSGSQRKSSTSQISKKRGSSLLNTTNSNEKNKTETQAKQNKSTAKRPILKGSESYDNNAQITSKQIPAEHFINNGGKVPDFLLEEDGTDQSLQNLRIDESNPDFLITERGKRIPRTGIIHQCHLQDPTTNSKCFKIFYGKNELLRHQEFVHATKKKIYKCIYCQTQGHKIQSYPRHDSLARHIRRKHGITGKENKEAVNYAKEHCEIIDEIKFPIVNKNQTNSSSNALQPGEIPLSEIQKMSLTLVRKRNLGKSSESKSKKSSSDSLVEQPQQLKQQQPQLQQQNQQQQHPIEGSSSSSFPLSPQNDTEKSKQIEHDDSTGKSKPNKSISPQVEDKQQSKDNNNNSNDQINEIPIYSRGKSNKNSIVMNLSSDEIKSQDSNKPTIINSKNNENNENNLKPFSIHMGPNSSNQESNPTKQPSRILKPINIPVFEDTESKNESLSESSLDE